MKQKIDPEQTLDFTSTLILEFPSIRTTRNKCYLYATCDSSNVLGPHNLIGSGTLRRCVLVGVDVVVEEVCYCGGRL